MILFGYDWLEQRESLTPQRKALIDLETKQTVTYQELNKRVDSIADFLWANGVRKGDRIAIISPNDISYFDLIFASAKIGSIFVPFNIRLSKKDIKYLLDDSKPAILFVHPDFLPLIDEIDTPEIVILDENYNNDSITLNSKWQSYKAALGFPAREYEKAGLSMDDPWIIIYTGGTTGFPKGAVLSYRSVIWNSINTILSWGIKDSDITVTYLPLFHTGGINALSMPVLHMGGTVVIGNHYEPAEAVKVIEEYKCTIILLVPTMYHMLIKTEEFKKAAFPSMEIFLSGGAPCPISIYDAFNVKGLKFKEGYGLTEAGPNNFYIDPKDALVKKGSVGKPMFYNQVKITDEKGNELPQGKVGEIWLAGPHLFKKYWNREKETKEAFHGEWFKTGDLGRQDEDGFYYIVGRKKEMIISGGENIYPLEIENALQQHLLVDEAVVVGLPDEKWGEVVSAFVVIKKNEQLNDSDLKDFLIKHLAKYKIPKKFYFLEELPKTAVGKISKTALINMYKQN